MKFKSTLKYKQHQKCFSKQNKTKIMIDKHNFATQKMYTDIFIEAYFSF